MKQAIVHHRDQTEPLDCPFGNVQRIVTGGEGGVANVHVVKVTKGTPHVHDGYDEVYYVLSGAGTITLGEHTYPLRPGTVAVIPAGLPHSLVANDEDALEFIIFGTPPMSIDDDRAKPKKVKTRTRPDRESK
jgi:mannose-6-phosphate isomerase-like protein (cupin superfamily)